MVHPLILAGSQLAVTTPSGLAQRDFFIRYTQLHSTFNGHAPYAADAVHLVADAIDRAETTDGTRIRDLLESTQYEGIAGAYAFSSISHSGVEPDALVVFRVRGGNWVRT